MSAPLPTWPYSRHIAHRGGGRLAPENTLAAMRVGAEHDFTMFEYDVKLSRDNVLVPVSYTHLDVYKRQIMDHGSIAQLGTPEDLYGTPVNAYVADFIGSANVIPVPARGGLAGAPAGHVRYELCGLGFDGTLGSAALRCV